MTEYFNIQVFEGIAARIFDFLYKEFPNPVDLDVSNIGIEVAKQLGLDDDATFKAMFTAGNTMEFLIKEDLISVSDGYNSLDSSGTEFHRCVLTKQGLAILGAIPSSIDGSIERRPIGQQLSEALQAGAQETVGEMVKKALNYAVGLGVTAVTHSV